MDGQNDGTHGNQGDGVTMADGLLHIEAVETVTGLEGTWVRVPDHGWTIANLVHIRANLKYNPDTCIEWVHRWVRECYLPVLPADATEPGYERTAVEPITDPKALTVAILVNEMDSKMLGFLMTAIEQGADTARTLSPFATRVSSNGTGKPPAAPNDTPARGQSKRRRKSPSAR